MDIRLASIEDIEKMIEINTKSMKEGYTKETWIETVNKNMSYVLLSNDVIIAYVLCEKRDDYCFIRSLAVMEEERRKGYATLLLMHLFSIYEKFKLYARSQNYRALNLYI